MLKYGRGKFCSRQCAGLSRRGKPLPLEWRRNLSIAQRKKIYAPNHGEKIKQGLHKSNIDRCGKNHPRWIDGRTSIRNLIYTSKAYKNWRNEILNRDNFTCKECENRTSGSFEVHHIKPFCEILDTFFIKYNYLSPNDDKTLLLKISQREPILWDVNNGITLCKQCHNKTRRWYIERI